MQCPAPQFTTKALIDGAVRPISLSDYLGKYVVLLFYPHDFTFVCPTEITSFSDRVKDFHNTGCNVLACSTDSVLAHKAWTEIPRMKGGLGSKGNIPLLEDKNLKISKAYGVFKERDGVTFSGTFIIDSLGHLRQISIFDLPVGRSVDETLRLVKAFQFADQHGVVCPVDWKPGEGTIKPHPEDKWEYFSNE